MSTASLSDSSHCPPPAVPATTLPPLSSLQPHPHPDRFCHAVRFSLPSLVTISACHHHCCRDPLLPLLALVAPSAAPLLLHRDVLMQSSQDADVDVKIGVNLPHVVDPWRSGAATSVPTMLPMLATTVVVIVVVYMSFSSLLPPRTLPLQSRRCQVSRCAATSR